MVGTSNKSVPDMATDVIHRNFKEKESETYEKLKIVDEEQLGLDFWGPVSGVILRCYWK